MEYLGIDGWAPFVDGAKKLILGKDSVQVKNDTVCSS